MPKLYVFDLDGTLVDSAGDIAVALNGALAQLGQPPIAREALIPMLGNGARKLCERALPEDSRALTDALLADYLVRYAAHPADISAPFSGIPALLAALRNAGHMLAVLSNKPDELMPAVLGSLFAPGTFALALGNSDRLPGKPAPDGLLYILEMLRVAPIDAAMVGDSTEDMQVARGAGVRGVGVAWGYRPPQALAEAGADAVAHTPEELLRLLTEQERPS